MNPFTRFLQQWTRDGELEMLVEHCDALQALIVRVYKQGNATGADEAEYQALRRWMKAHYGSWQDALRPFWQDQKHTGDNVGSDPFEAMYNRSYASEFVGAWDLMQQLPNAREALNRLILKRSSGAR